MRKSLIWLLIAAAPISSAEAASYAIREQSADAMATAYATCGSGMRVTRNIRRPWGARFAFRSRGKSSPPVT